MDIVIVVYNRKKKKYTAYDLFNRNVLVFSGDMRAHQVMQYLQKVDELKVGNHGYRHKPF